MKLLFITYHYLSGKGGGVYASRAYINIFAEIAEKMTLLYPMRVGSEPVDINPSINAIPVWDNRSKLKKFFCLLFGFNNRFQNINRYIDDENYDFVIFDTSMVSWGLIDYFKKLGTKVITIHHNYQYEYFRDNTTGLTRSATLFWTKQIERDAVRKSDLNLTLTKSDKDLLSFHYGNGKEHIEVLGTFEYQKKSHPLYPDIEEPRFLITGNLSSMQTENSLLPWLDEYFPLLQDVFPGAKLTLAGKSPSYRLVEKASRLGITVISSPESMIPILAKSKYYICATSLGGGLKLRVLDGLSAGLPVICHEVSARGYEIFAENGVLLVYRDKSSFHSQLMILKDLNYNKKDIISLFENEFSFSIGKKRINHLLNDYFITK